MRLSQLETLLDSMKGEESIFRLFHEEKYEELKEINELFKSTKLYNVYNFNDIIANAKQQSLVCGIYGEKGIGKSTLASSIIVDNYITGNIDEIIYKRYNPTTQNFEEIFQVKRNSPLARAVVLDDVHFFVPDLIENILIKGSVQSFDRFVRTLFDMNMLFREKGVKYALTYISDAHSLRALHTFYSKLLMVADRGDLIQFLPKISKPSCEIEVNKDFYGRTYAVAGGNINLYQAADVFGNLIREETGLLATNPRLLKFLIRELKNYRKQIDFRLFKFEEIAKNILKGEVVTQPEIVTRLYNEASKVLNEFYYHLEDFRGEIQDEFKLLSSQIDTWKSNFLKSLHDIEQSTKTKVELVNNMAEETKVKRPYIIPTDQDIAKNWEAHKIVAERLVNATNISGMLDKTQETINNLRNFMGEMVENHKILSKLGRDIRRLNRSVEKEVLKIKGVLDHYTQILRQPHELNKYSSIYTEIKSKAESFASSQPQLFYISDLMPIKNLIDNPNETIRKINLNTISLIRDLSIIPY